MQTATADTLVGRRLEGRYRILDRIARGGMSTVYAAVDERLDRMVAVKVMSSVLSNDPAFSDRFAREARAAARLTHLNAVSVYDQGHDSGPDVGNGGHHVFLVMELVEGRTLRELLRERGRLTVAEAVSIMEPVLSALSAAHRAGLVHRDVKPENILLSDEGVVKVADFGLARAVETDPSNTRTGLMMGTVAYCAPEQISKGNADPRSDVYAAGIVLFEMLTGSPPYSGESAMNIAWQHVNSRVPAPSSQVRDVPSEIDEVVVAATDSDPSGRPSDAGSFLAEIADVRTELALPVVPVPARVRPRREQRRNDSHAREPDHATTDLLGDRPRRHDTTVAPDHETRRGHSGRSAQRDSEPPPPVVIPPRRQRQHRKRRAAIAWVVVILLGLGSFFGARAIIEWRFAHIPDVGGQQRTAAERTLRDAGYQIKVNPGGVFDSTVPKGEVVRTDPDGGTRLATGRTVTITLSNGPQTYRIPSLRRTLPDAARRQLIGLGKVTVAEQVRQEYSDTVPEGSVTRTRPAAGALVTGDDTITIYVSKGVPYVEVPALADGTSADDETTALHHSAGRFRTSTTEAYSDTVASGDVISIDPTGRARKFSRITVTVSKGRHTATVPTIAFGTPLAEAEASVRAVGLVPNPVAFLGPGTPDSGRTVGTSPDAGKVVDYGSTVTLQILPG